jgi:Ca2+-binding EF-hand superfamily protein
MTRRNLLIALMSATAGLALTDVTQKPAAANPPDKLALADVNVKQLLLLMDADNNDKISKMNFMEAEFNKLDKDGNGELDRKELLQSKVSVRQGSSANAAR